MYIENGYVTKNSPWLFLVMPLIFFGFVGMNILIMLLIDTEAMMKASIEQQGELLFLTTGLLSFAFLLVLLLVWVKYVQGQSLTNLTTSRKKVDWSRIFFAFILWGSISAISVLVDYKLNPENYVWNFQLVPFLILFFIVLILIPLQTSFEEYFFRGHLMQGLGIAVKNRWFPLLFTSVTFGLMHIANPEVEKMGCTILLYYIGTGFFLGIITLMDEGLELALGFHAANNMITALLVTANWTAFQTPSVLKDTSNPTAGVDIFLPLLIFFPLLVIIFARKYHWTGWKTNYSVKCYQKMNF